MEPILTHAEMNEKRMMLQDDAPAQAALAIIEKHNGRLDMSFDELWAENNNLWIIYTAKKRQIPMVSHAENSPRRTLRQ